MAPPVFKKNARILNRGWKKGFKAWQITLGLLNETTYLEIFSNPSLNFFYHISRPKPNYFGFYKCLKRINLHLLHITTLQILTALLLLIRDMHFNFRNTHESCSNNRKTSSYLLRYITFSVSFVRPLRQPHL